MEEDRKSHQKQIIMTSLWSYIVRPTLLAIAAVVALASCSIPYISNEFQTPSQRDTLGRYTYVLDMSDTLSSFDISIYTRIDCGVLSFDQLKDVPILVTLQSPSGDSFSEYAYIPRSAFNTDRRGSYDAVVDYRLDCIPIEYGLWQMYLATPKMSGHRGFGVILRSKQL